MNETHGEYGQLNRKFLTGIYQPKSTEIFMKINSPPTPFPLNMILEPS